MEVGNWAGIGIVAGLVAQPAVAIGNAQALVFGEAEVAGTPAFDQNRAHIGDATERAGGDHPRVMAGHDGTGFELVADNARFSPLYVTPVMEPGIGECHDAIPGLAGCGIIAAHESPARRVAGAQFLAAWFIKGDGLEPGAIAQAAAVAHRSGGAGNFFGAKGIKRMRGHRSSFTGGGGTGHRISPATQGRPAVPRR